MKVTSVNKVTEIVIMSKAAPFCEMVRATGAAEIWTHSYDNSIKFRQFGWRCTNNENLFETDTLIGNWCEERCDISKRKIPEPMPSQFGHYFDSIHNSSFNKVPRTQVPDVLKNCRSRHSHSFPGHQPDFDSDYLKDIYNSYTTTQRADYMDPSLRRVPIVVNKQVPSSNSAPKNR